MKNKKRNREKPYLTLVYIPNKNTLILQFLARDFAYVDKWVVADLHEVRKILRLLPSFTDKEITRALRSLNKNRIYYHFYPRIPRGVK